MTRKSTQMLAFNSAPLALQEEFLADVLEELHESLPPGLSGILVVFFPEDQDKRGPLVTTDLDLECLPKLLREMADKFDAGRVKEYVK